MKFNMFGGKTEFVVINDSTISIQITTKQARKKVNSQGKTIFIPDILGHHLGGDYSFGRLFLPHRTLIYIEGYTRPYYENGKCFKIRLDFRDTATTLGVFYIYTDIISMENIDLEPCK